MIRPFRLVSSRDLETICARTLSIADAWSRHWLPGGAGLVVGDARAAASADAWRDVLLVGDVQCVIRVEPPQRRRLAAALLGDEAHADDATGSELIDDLCRRALGALGARLAGVKVADDSVITATGDVPAQWLAPGSGSVVVELDAGDATVEVLLPGVITHEWLGESQAPRPAEALSDPRLALGRQRVKAICELQDTELELGELAGLAIGDVIGLDHPLDRPLRLRFEGAGVTCEGYLCEHEAHDAILLVRAAAD